MIKREAKFGLLFRHWLKANPQSFPRGAVFELKQTSGALPFDAVQEHQILALLAAKKSSFLYKIPDDSRGVKPFDMAYFSQTPAFVVIKFPTHFEIIEVEQFLNEKNKSDRKSLTSERARAISIIGVSTKK